MRHNICGARGVMSVRRVPRFVFFHYFCTRLCGHKNSQNLPDFKDLTPKVDILTPKAANFSKLQFPPDRHPGRLVPPLEESSSIEVGCFRSDYSASAIARAVEDADAHLLNLNVTADVCEGGEVVVALRVSHRNPAAVVRSLERHGYNVLSAKGSDGTDGFGPEAETASRRLAELMAHLNV